MFSQRLKELRKKQNLTQQDFAEALAVSQGTVAMWETDKRQPDLLTLQKIAEYFSVSVDFLLGYDVPESDNPLDAELKGIMFALSSGAENMSDESKKDIIDFYRFKKEQEKRKKG